jgi:hypothetical protein
MTTEALTKELRSRGVVTLAVSPHRSLPDVLVVYLHGNAGQWVDGAAARQVARIPGVVAVSESVPTPTILLVRIQPDA